MKTVAMHIYEYLYSYACVYVFVVVVQSPSCVQPFDPMDCSTPGFPVLHSVLEFAQTHVFESVMPSNHLCLCSPLLFLSSIFWSPRDWILSSRVCSMKCMSSLSSTPQQMLYSFFRNVFTGRGLVFRTEPLPGACGAAAILKNPSQGSRMAKENSC